MLARLKPIMTKHLMIAFAHVIVGIGVVIIAEWQHLHWLRLVGAILISGGGTIIGVYTGLADPRMLRVPEWLKSWRVTAALVTTLIITLPAVAVLIGVFAGLFRDTPTARDAGMLAFGAIVALLMLALTALLAVVAIRSIIHAGREQPRPSEERWTPEGEQA
jgi:hypothetical protein